MRRALVLLLLIVLPLTFGLAADPAEGHGDEGHDSITPWKALNFALLAGVLIYLLRKPARNFFVSRTAEIREGIDEATRSRGEAETRAAEMDRRLANLSTEVESLRQSARQEMEAEDARTRAATEQALARMQSQAGQEVESATSVARKQLRAYSAELALELARQKIQARMTPEVAGRLLDDFSASLPRNSEQ